MKVHPTGPRLVCSSCAATYDPMQLRWRCDCADRGVLDLVHKASLRMEDLAAPFGGMWRYGSSIPLPDRDMIISLGEGGTPMTAMNWDGAGIHIKLDMLMPTGSYKDRGASAMISRACRLGAARVIEDSSGNAGASVAAYCAACSIPCEIFVPSKTSGSKLAQIESYGATLRLVDGHRDQVAATALEHANKPGTYYASHVWDPYFLQGTKTIAYEIWEQLGRCAPDRMIIPTGNGTLLLGAYIGFSELLRQKLIEKLPKLTAVQAENCAPLHSSFKGQPVTTPHPTIAEGIAIPNPVRGDQIVSCVEKTGGTIVTVTEDQISAAKDHAANLGLLIEPTSATAFAAIDANQLDPDEVTVVPITGHGLKTIGK